MAVVLSLPYRFSLLFGESAELSTAYSLFIVGVTG